jgi:hypothetical protein
MIPLNPWKFGAVLSITVVIGYLLCAVFWYSLPGPSMELVNALFHGMDFRKIYTPASFAVSSFIFVLAVLTAWAYVLGAIYAVVRNLLVAESKA